MDEIGKLVAMVAFILAVIAGILSAAGVGFFVANAGTVSIILVISGIIIGLLNVGIKEEVPLMLGVLVIAIGSTALAIIPQIDKFVGAIFGNIATLVIPAGLVVALVVVYDKLKG